MRRTCLKSIHEIARRDSRVVFVGSDLGPGTLDEFRDEMPERFFMEGVSEANVIGMAAGLALDGFIPYVNTIATFLTRRCFEQVAMDICLHNLPVRLIGNGGGLVYAPLGPTHIAIDDIALMRSAPNMAVVAPADADEMARFMEQSLEWASPIYIRLAKGGDPIVSRPEDVFSIGTAIPLRPPGDVLLIASGAMVNRALSAADILAEAGIAAGVLNVHTIKPLDEKTLLEFATKVRLMVTLDEHLLSGGLGSAVTELLVDRLTGPLPEIKRIGIPDTYTEDYGSQDSLMESLGLQPPHIAETVKVAYGKLRPAN